VGLIVEGPFFEKIRVSTEENFGVIELRDILVLFGDGSIELGLERARIDDCQQVAFLHILTLLKGDLGQDSADLRVEGPYIERLHCSNAVEVDGNAAFLHDARDNGDRAAWPAT